MLKLIICCGGKPNFNGHKRRMYRWTEKYKCFVWEGRELDPSEFNKVVEGAFQRNYDLRPFVKVVEVDGTAVGVSPDGSIPSIEDVKGMVAELEKVRGLRVTDGEEHMQRRHDLLAVRNEVLAKDEEITRLKEQLATTEQALAAQPATAVDEVPPDAPPPIEPTLEQALAIVEKLAPDRIRKKSGPKPVPAP